MLLMICHATGAASSLTGLLETGLSRPFIQFGYLPIPIQGLIPVLEMHMWEKGHRSISQLTHACHF